MKIEKKVLCEKLYWQSIQRKANHSKRGEVGVVNRQTDRINKKKVKKSFGEMKISSNKC